MIRGLFLRTIINCGTLNRWHSRRIVWLTQLIGNALDVDDAVVPIKHKDGLSELLPLASATHHSPTRTGYCDGLSQRGEIVRTAFTDENFCSQCNWYKARTHP